MTPKERAAMQQALSTDEALMALEIILKDGIEHGGWPLNKNCEDGLSAIAALREALDHSGEANEMVEFFSKEMKNKISVARAEQAEQRIGDMKQENGIDYVYTGHRWDKVVYPEQEPVAWIAALFVQENGCYANLKNVDAWPEHRDARKYKGPFPVVAHPPCQLWGALAAVNYARWGGDHNRPGNDGGCFSSALTSVRKFGGVLEHPAKTKAFAEHGIEKPSGKGWKRTNDGGWVCEVWQSAYGHRANKATWLYYFGCRKPFELKWDRPIGSHQVGYRDQRGKEKNKPTLGKQEANATPAEFRDELIRLALYAAPVRTKDLTDEEIRAVLDKHCGDGLMAIAYAVIAADLEKNK